MLRTFKVLMFSATLALGAAPSFAANQKCDNGTECGDQCGGGGCHDGCPADDHCCDNCDDACSPDQPCDDGCGCDHGGGN